MLNHIQRRLLLQAKMREVIRKGVGVLSAPKAQPLTETKPQPKK